MLWRKLTNVTIEKTLRFARGAVIITRNANGTDTRVDLAELASLSNLEQVNLAAATQTLTVAQSGQRFVGAVDAVFTLPASSIATKGVNYTFETGAVSAGTGLSISPAAADNIRGNGLSAVDNKDLINTGATDRLGDMVHIYNDGADWVIDQIIGTWAKES